MSKNDMIKILEEHLKDKSVNYYETSIEYKGKRENVPQLDGSKGAFHVLSYLVSISENLYDSDTTYYAYFKVDSEDLSYIIGPQFYEKVDNE